MPEETREFVPRTMITSIHSGTLLIVLHKFFYEGRSGMNTKKWGVKEGGKERKANHSLSIIKMLG